MTSMAPLPEGAILIGRVTIEMFLPEEGDDQIVRTHVEDTNGKMLPTIQSLGMVEFARQSIWHMSEED